MRLKSKYLSFFFSPFLLLLPRHSLCTLILDMATPPVTPLPYIPFGPRQSPTYNYTTYVEIVVENEADSTAAEVVNEFFYTEDCPQDGLWGRGLDCTECPTGPPGVVCVCVCVCVCVVTS